MRSKIEEWTDGPLWLAILMAPVYLLAYLVAAAFLVGACSGPVLLFAAIVLGLAE